MNNPCQNKECEFFNETDSDGCDGIVRMYLHKCKDYKPEPDKPKLSHDEIMNNLLWHRDQKAIIRIGKYRAEYYYWPNDNAPIGYFHNHCELYTNQDKT